MPRRMEALKKDGRLLALSAKPRSTGFDAGAYDADKTYFGSKLITTGIAVNTAAKSRPTSWADLAKPEYKGQIAMPSPLYSGAAAIMLGTMTDAPGSRLELLREAEGGRRRRGARQRRRADGGGERREDRTACSSTSWRSTPRPKARRSTSSFPRKAIPAVTEPVAILKTTQNAGRGARVRRFHPLRRRPEARGRRWATSRPRPSVGLPSWLPGRHEDQPDADRHSPRSCRPTAPT